MNFETVVHDGRVVLEVGSTWPEGTAVRVTVTPAPPPAPPEAAPTLAWMLKYAGRATGLPPDLAAQHDHYLHGTPKR